MKSKGASTSSFINILLLRVLLVVIVVLATLKYCRDTERPKSFFRNYDEVKGSGLMEKGWIPPYLPKSARHIHETHDLDTNHVHITFEYRPGDTKDVEQACEKDQHRSSESVSVYVCCREGDYRFVIKLNRNGKGEIKGSPL